MNEPTQTALFQSAPSNIRPMPARNSAPEPPEDPKGNGTTGPSPRPAKAPRNANQGPIPMNVAFREVTAFVIKELKESGEQWTSEAKQDLVSTILIAASRQKLLTVWER